VPGSSPDEEKCWTPAKSIPGVSWYHVEPHIVGHRAATITTNIAAAAARSIVSIPAVQPCRGPAGLSVVTCCVPTFAASRSVEERQPLGNSLGNHRLPFPRLQLALPISQRSHFDEGVTLARPLLSHFQSSLAQELPATWRTVLPCSTQSLPLVHVPERRYRCGRYAGGRDGVGGKGVGGYRVGGAEWAVQSGQRVQGGRDRVGSTEWAVEGGREQGRRHRVGSTGWTVQGGRSRVGAQGSRWGGFQLSRWS